MRSASRFLVLALNLGRRDSATSRAPCNGYFRPEKNWRGGSVAPGAIAYFRLERIGRTNGSLRVGTRSCAPVASVDLDWRNRCTVTRNARLLRGELRCCILCLLRWPARFNTTRAQSVSERENAAALTDGRPPASAVGQLVETSGASARSCVRAPAVLHPRHVGVGRGGIKDWRCRHRAVDAPSTSSDDRIFRFRIFRPRKADVTEGPGDRVRPTWVREPAFSAR